MRGITCCLSACTQASIVVWPEPLETGGTHPPIVTPPLPPPPPSSTSTTRSSRQHHLGRVSTQRVRPLRGRQGQASSTSPPCVYGPRPSPVTHHSCHGAHDSQRARLYIRLMAKRWIGECGTELDPATVSRRGKDRHATRSIRLLSPTTNARFCFFKLHQKQEHYSSWSNTRASMEFSSRWPFSDGQITFGIVDMITGCVFN